MEAFIVLLVLVAIVAVIVLAMRYGQKVTSSLKRLVTPPNSVEEAERRRRVAFIRLASQEAIRACNFVVDKIDELQAAQDALETALPANLAVAQAGVDNARQAVTDAERIKVARLRAYERARTQ